MDFEFSDITYKISRGWREKGNLEISSATTRSYYLTGNFKEDPAKSYQSENADGDKGWGCSRILLHGISGTFRSGHLSAIMGPSGAGKSTLLNILSGYRSTETGIQGEIKINGKPIDQRLFHKYTRYIAQEDLLPSFLTTYEAMMFAANLKLLWSTSQQEKDKEIMHILGMLGLGECRETNVEALSGGQRKRLSLALEMINNPSVFFLDEPTSGLDNVSTKQCLELLSKLAKENRTIICTIHQPSATLFELFDQIYILGGGRCVYQGPARKLLPFLSSAGFSCPPYHNPSDFVMEVIDSSETNIAILSKAIENGKLIYSASARMANQPEDILGTCYPEPGKRQFYSLQPTERSTQKQLHSINYPTNFIQQFTTILRRMILQHGRNKTALKISFLHHLACGLLFGSVFYKSANDAHQMFNHMKYCVGYVLFFTYTYVMVPVLTYPAQVKLLKKEHFNRWYGLNPYYAALVVTKLPTQILFGFMFSCLVYFMAGLPVQSFRFALFFLIGFIVTLISDAVGTAIGSIFNVTNGSAVGPMLVAPLLGLAVYGFDFARQVPWFIYVIMKLSFIRCGVVATAITLFGFGRGTMECKEVYCHFKEPRLILDFLDVEHVSVWSEISALVLILIFFRITNYYCLKHRLSVK